MDKQRFDQVLLAIRDPYFEATARAVDQQPFLRLAPSTSRIGFVDESQASVSLPDGPGLYLCYALDADVPYYVGSGGNLRQRLKYHAGNGASSDRESTLKKKTTAHFGLSEPAGSAFLAEHVRFKVVPVPLGRLEVEFFLHERWQINTAARSRAST